MGMKNRKIKVSILVLGVAVIFYQLHGMNYFNGFKPEWLTQENLRNKSYNVIRSPLFWMVLGSGVIAFAIWNRPKNRPAPGEGAPPSSDSAAPSPSMPVGVSGAPLPSQGGARSAVEQLGQEDEKKKKALDAKLKREQEEADHQQWQAETRDVFYGRGFGRNYVPPSQEELQTQREQSSRYREEEEQRMFREMEAEVLPNITVDEKIGEILESIGEFGREALYNLINQFIKDRRWFTTARLRGWTTSDFIAFFTELKSYFSVMYLLTQVAKSYRGRHYDNTRNTQVSQALKEFIKIYTSLHLFAQMDAVDIDILKKYYKTDDVIRYLIAQLNTAKAKQRVRIFEDGKNFKTLSPKGRNILAWIFDLPMAESANVVPERIKLADKIDQFIVDYYIFQSDMPRIEVRSSPTTMLRFWDAILTDTWIEDFAKYEKFIDHAVSLLDEQMIN